MTARCAWLILTAIIQLLYIPHAHADNRVYSFGVLPQHSAVLTAQYWNPILTFISRKSGIRLELKIAKSGPEHSAKIGQSLYDFAYSNHIFNLHNAKAGYSVFARPDEDMIRGEIVVLEGSPVRKLEELNDLEVGFASRAAFVGYAVTMDALIRHGVTVKPVFGGNQEGIMTQLKAGKVMAAGVNSQIMRNFAQREHLQYRILWQSPEYRNLPFVAHPRVPVNVVSAVRKAMIEMARDPEGARILEASAALIGQKPPYGFEAATDREYKNQWDFYKQTVVPELRK